MSPSLTKLTIHDLMRWGIYALIVLVPTVYHTEFDSAFTTPKLLVVRIITLAMVFIWAIQIVVQRKLLYRSSPMNRWTAASAAILLFATLFSEYPWVSVFGDQDRFLGLFTMLNMLFLVIVVMNFFQTKKEIQRFIGISVATAVVLSIYGLLQFKGILGAKDWDHDPTLRVFGTMGHSNHFAAYLGMHILLLMGLLLNSKQRSHQILYALGLIPMFATLLATASRGAVVALMVSMGVFFGILAWEKREWIAKSRKKIVAVGIAMVLVGMVFNGPIRNRLIHLSLTQRTLETIEFIGQGNVPDRVSWWFSSAAMVRDHPLFGHGLSTFRDTYNVYRRTDYRVPGDEQDRFTPETAHMQYFDVVATQGIIGLLVYLGFVLMGFRLLFRVLRNKEQSLSMRITALSLFTAALAYYIQLLMSFEVIGTLTSMMLFWGISLTLYHITSDPKPQSQQFAEVPIEGAVRAGGTLAFATIWFLCLWFSYRGAAAEFYAKQAQQAQKAKEVGEMLENHQKSADAMHWMYQYPLNQGDGAFEFATYEGLEVEKAEFLIKKSITGYENAYALMKTQPYIQGNLALAYIFYADILEAKGIKTEAEEWRDKGIHLYREAVTVGVNNPRFSYTLGKLLLSLNRQQEAAEAFEYALVIRDPYMDTYYQLALIATNQKDYETARIYIQKALREDPSDENVKALLQRINAESPSI